jgi:hypothetical protein
MCHSPPTGEMWSEAIVKTFRARASINAALAELQAERERVCECNQPGYQAPPVEHAPRVQPSPEELAARQAARAARIQAVVEAKRRYLRDRGEYARPRPLRREIPRDPVLAEPDRPNPLPGGACCRP